MTEPARIPGRPASLGEPSDPVALLAAMVAFDTVNGRIAGRQGSERPLAEALLALAESWGMEAALTPFDDGAYASCNLLVSVPCGDPSRPWLLLESHLDTVAADTMTVPPFAAEIRDGKLWGRGSCDTKVNGAAMLWALREASRSGELANSAAILFTADEEVGKAGIRHFVRDQLPELPWKPALALVGEPTLLAPVVAHNGAVRCKIATRGIAAHSSNPALGRSAIRDMVRVISLLEENYIPCLSARHPLTGKCQCSINQISGGRQANIIPDYCEITVDRRIVPGESAEGVVAEIQSCLEQARDRDPEIRVEITEFLHDPALAPGEADFALGFLRPALERMALPCEPSGMPYGTDAANLAGVGVPSVVIGAGDIAQAHTQDEWVAIEQLEKGVGLFREILATPLV